MSETNPPGRLWATEGDAPHQWLPRRRFDFHPEYWDVACKGCKGLRFVEVQVR